MIRSYLRARTEAKLAKASYWKKREKETPREIKEEVAERKRLANCRHNWERIKENYWCGAGDYVDVLYICKKCLKDEVKNIVLS